MKGRGSARLGEYKERSDRRVSGASTHPRYIGIAFQTLLFLVIFTLSFFIYGDTAHEVLNWKAFFIYILPVKFHRKRCFRIEAIKI